MLKRIWKMGGAKFSIILILAFVVFSYFAPLIANNKPIICSYKGKLIFPAFRDLYPFNKVLKKDEISLKLQMNPSFLKSAKEDASIKFAIMPICPYSPFEPDLEDILKKPSFKTKHFFGCDDNGRDIFARLIYGSKNSLLVGFVSVFISGFIGILIGGIGGYFGGLVDSVFVSRAIEVMLSFPTFFLIITVAAVLDPKFLNIYTLMIIIGLTSWSAIARYTRGEFIKLKEIEFVSSAKVNGASSLRIILKHLLPNSLAPIIVTLTFGVGGAILAESGLSFLGVGVQPPEPSWGNVLRGIEKSWNSWWIGVFPGLMIFLAVLSYNILGESIRDVFDPKENRV